MPPRTPLKCFNCGTNGHGVRECPDISCHYCHDRGHIVDNCPKKRHRSPVGSETGSDHGGRGGAQPYRAPHVTLGSGGAAMGLGGGFGSDNDKCFTCKEYGHRSEACAMTVCHDCGRKGHIAKSCPKKDEHKKCFFCKRKGHQIADCDLKKLYPNEEKLCYMCLQPGHHANECTNAAVCHKCNQSGHLSNDCPNRECNNCHDKGHSAGKCPTVRCFRCNENGHMANECEDETIGIVPTNAKPASEGQQTPAAAATTGSSYQHTAGTGVLQQEQQPPQASSNNYHITQQHQQQQQQQHGVSPVSVATLPSVFPNNAQQSAALGVLQQHQQQQQFTVLSPIPPLDDAAAAAYASSRAVNGRVCVLIDGPYFEASVRQSTDPTGTMPPNFSRVRLALQHTLQFIGGIFDKTPYGFWFDMDPTSMCEFIEQEFAHPQKDVAMRRLHAKHGELISHMCSGRGLSNVVTRLVGKIRHRPVVSSMGFGGSWMPAGVDVAIATSIIECFESKQFSQVVLLSGDGALCPAVDYCNAKRQAFGGMGMGMGMGMGGDGSAKAPVRVCGSMGTMDALFGSKQELVDFLPRIFLDAPEHIEEGKKVPFPIHNAFQ